jgi:hypothetical protein
MGGGAPAQNATLTEDPAICADCAFDADDPSSAFFRRAAPCLLA